MIERWRANGTVAVVAALLLVLQSALGSVAMGGEPVQRDIFGNVICTDSRPGQDPANDGGGHLPNCCLPGCASGVQGAADVPGATAVIDAPQTHDAASFPATHHPFVFATQRRQGNPRAPPEAA